MVHLDFSQASEFLELIDTTNICFTNSFGPEISQQKGMWNKKYDRFLLVRIHFEGKVSKE